MTIIRTQAIGQPQGSQAKAFQGIFCLRATLAELLGSEQRGPSAHSRGDPPDRELLPPFLKGLCKWMACHCHVHNPHLHVNHEGRLWPNHSLERWSGKRTWVITPALHVVWEQSMKPSKITWWLTRDLIMTALVQSQHRWLNTQFLGGTNSLVLSC